jgi:methionyl-tRNA formyltransferase
MRVLMLGTPAFAVPTLEALLASRHEVVGLVCQPDRPRGRGHKVLAPPAKAVAEAHGVPVFQPVKLKDPALLESLSALHADLGVVAAYGRILPDALIALPARGMINVHASLLPRYRGAAPIQRAVIAGDETTGVTIMRVVRELDAGPMLAAEPFPIADDATSVDVERGLARSGARLLVEVVDRLDAGEAVAEIPQDERLATYAAKIEREDGRIDWSRSPRQIHDLVRGLHPWPHAFAFLGRERFLIHRTAIAADGTLRILEIQPEGKRVMSMREWLAGRRDLAGAPRFTSEPS